MKLAFAVSTLFSLASGCAAIEADAHVRNVRINVWRDGFAKAEFEQAEPVALRELGACKLTEWSVVQPHEFRAQAGVLHIAARGEPVTLTPDWHGEYRNSERRGDPLWIDGDTITVTADGGALPAFTAQLPAPPAIESIDPPREDPTFHPEANASGCRECVVRPPRIWALRDLPLRWTPRAGARYTVELINGPKRVRCDFDGKLGQASVPQELIAELWAGSSVELRVTSSSETIVQVHGWNVHVMAWSPSSKQYLSLDPRNLNEPGDYH